MKTNASLIGLLLLFTTYVGAQEGANISGNLEMNGNFFQTDTTIGAFNTPQYDRQLYGADVWMQLNYSYKGFDVGLRFDVFNNSNLLNPQGSYNAQGIGRWFIKKQIDKLGISAGYLYDQVGSGLIFRAFEQRPLLIDNALYGLRLTYDILPDWQIKAFTGRQKRQFDLYDSVVKGISVDGFLSGGKGDKAWSMAPGFGIVSRTLDDETMGIIVGTINTYAVQDSIVPRYNVYAFSLFNTFTIGNFSCYVEGAYKTEETIFDPFAIKSKREDTTTTVGKLVSRPGAVFYTNLGYAAKGLGISLEAKYTKDFSYRPDPLQTGNQGLLNFLPPMARVNTYRLLARYTPATQDLGEQALQLDVRYSPTRKLSFNVNTSYISTLGENRGVLDANTLLYWELFTEVVYKYKRQWQFTGGLQMQEYNQDVYLTKPGKDNITTITPYAEFLYRFSRKKAFRAEFQYMHTRQDYGSWLFALAEFSIAPHWSFSVSDMYNVRPNDSLNSENVNDAAPRNNSGEFLKVHFPRFDVFYTRKANRFSLSYVKQVEGIVCAGGICRLEPAFSGVKATVQSTF
ncbi:MAG: DUF6029 family protein [Bacteroidota bacterium]